MEDIDQEVYGFFEYELTEDTITIDGTEYQIPREVSAVIACQYDFINERVLFVEAVEEEEEEIPVVVH